MQQIKNIKDLRLSLLDNYTKLKNKKMTVQLGKELANTAGKVISGLKLQLEQNRQLNKKEEIDFLSEGK